MKKVFLSHSSDDGAAVFQLAASLSELGISSWYAPRDVSPGADWADSILKALEQSHSVILFCTKAAIASGQVRKEIEYAQSKKIDLLVLLPDASLEVPYWLQYNLPSRNVLQLESVKNGSIPIFIMQKLYPVGISKTKSFSLPDWPYAAVPAVKPPTSQEMRPVFLLYFETPPELSLSEQNRVLESVSGLCRANGARMLLTGLPGMLHAFDSLARKTSLPGIVQCCRDIEILTTSPDIVKNTSVCMKTAVDTTFTLASSGNELLQHADITVRNIQELSGINPGKAVFSAQAASALSHLAAFTSVDSDSFVLDPASQEISTVYHSAGVFCRENALQKLLDSIQGVEDRQFGPGLGGNSFSVIGVSGPHGSGKSSLVMKLMQLLERKAPHRIVTARPDRAGWLHNGLWGNLLEQIQNTFRKSSPSPDRESLRFIAENGRNSNAPEVNLLHSWRADLSRVLDDLSSTGLDLIVLEDIDRAEPASLYTLFCLIRKKSVRRKTVFILTYSNSSKDFLELLQNEQSGRSEMIEIRLGPVSDDEALICLTRVLSENSERCADKEQIVHQLNLLSNGIPGRLVRIADYWIRSGIVSAGFDNYSQYTAKELLPPSLQWEALEKLAMLNRQQRSFLRSVAEAGNWFRADTSLLDTFDYTDRQSLLSELTGKGLLIRRRASSSAEYRFREEFLRVAVNGTLPPKD